MIDIKIIYIFFRCKTDMKNMKDIFLRDIININLIFDVKIMKRNL